MTTGRINQVTTEQGRRAPTCTPTQSPDRRCGYQGAGGSCVLEARPHTQNPCCLKPTFRPPQHRQRTATNRCRNTGVAAGGAVAPAGRPARAFVKASRPAGLATAQNLRIRIAYYNGPTILRPTAIVGLVHTSVCTLTDRATRWSSRARIGRRRLQHGAAHGRSSATGCRSTGRR